VKRGLIVFGHGSRDPLWADTLKARRERLHIALPGTEVELAYLEFLKPTLSQCVDALWQRGCEPVVVAWDGAATALALRVPSSQQGTRVSCELALETGEQKRWACGIEQLPVSRAADVEGVNYVTRRLELPAGLPLGYHRLTIELGSARVASLIISAPTHAYALPEGTKLWGVFLPLYALRTQRSLGSGTFADLHALTTWVNGLGGSVVATLPMLAAFLDEPFEPSPYAPASRLFWNEFYLDMMGAPEFASCPAAQALLKSAPVAAEVDALRQAPLVDYRREMALKRRVLVELAKTAREQPPASPELEAYAKFRAVEQRQRRSWHVWPSPQKEGAISEGDYDPAVTVEFDLARSIPVDGRIQIPLHKVQERPEERAGRDVAHLDCRLHTSAPSPEVDGHQPVGLSHSIHLLSAHCS